MGPIRYAFILLAFVSMPTQGQIFQWAGHFGAASNQYTHDVKLAPDGFVYVVGYFQGANDLDPTPGEDLVTAVGGQNGYVVKLDSDGNYIWGGQFSGGPCLATSLAISGDGNILVAGTFSGTVDFDPGPGVANLTAPVSTWYFLCSLSPDGEYQWAKRFGSNGPLYDPAIAVDAQGRIHYTGTFPGTMDADPGDGPGEVVNLVSNGGNDAFISTFDAQGGFIRAISFGASGDDRGRAIAADDEGHILVTGFYVGTIDIPTSSGPLTLTNNSGSAYNDIFLLKMDPDGDVLWAKSLGGNGYDRGYALAVNDAGEIFLAGSVESGADLDPGPGVVTSTNPEAAFYVKFDPDGNYLHSFTSQYAGASDNQARAIGFDGNGNIYLAGRFNGGGGGVDFDPGPGNTAYVTSGNSADGFIACYNAEGTYLWSVQLGSEVSGQEWVYGLAIGANGACYAVGTFSGSFPNSIDMDPGPGTFMLELIGVGSNDGFILKLDPIGLGQEQVPGSLQGLKLWPNPSQGLIHVDWQRSMPPTPFKVIDAGGRVVREGVLPGGGQSVLQLGGCPSGSYTLEVIISDERQYQRFIRE